QQALAGALIVPNGLGILRRAAGERAGMHFGLTGAMSGAGATLGPLVGGLLTAIDWRLVFLVNVPVVALAFVLARSTIPDERARPETKFDVVGVASLGILLTTAAWLLTSLGRGAPDGTTAALAVAVIIGATLFVRYELRQPDAALPPALFRIRAFTAANAAIAFANLSLYATLLAVPALLAADASSTVLVGVALTALSAAMVVLGPATGWLVDRYGARWPPTLGGVLIVVGCLATGAVITHAQFPLLLASLLVLGAGVSLTFPATRVAAVDAVPARYVALASGVVSTSRYFGGMLGAIFAGVALAANDVSNASVLFAVLAMSGALASLASLGLPGSAHVSDGAEAVTPGS
ncbi:MAG: MFS transporter, partial [Chloroflexota bacterium]